MQDEFDIQAYCFQYGNTREERALKMLQQPGFRITEIDSGYKVPSQRNAGIMYNVTLFPARCDCLDHILNGNRCKHILLVKWYKD